MSNLFDTVNYAQNEPEVVQAGDTWNWKRGLSDYPVASYALTYVFRKNDGTATINITATESSSPNEYLVSVAAATTANYSDGVYQWDSYITRSSDNARLRLRQGRTEVLPNYPKASDAQTALDAIDAVMNNRASLDQLSFSIAGRSISRMHVDDLIKFRQYYASRVQAEISRQRIQAGQKTGQTVQVRF